LSGVLDQGLKALPDKYRAVIVLCDLEGKSIKEAAQELGCPEGTVGTRRARGRNLLARWLGRRGLALAGGMIALAKAPAAPLLLVSTVNAALSVAAGRATATGAFSPRVAALAEGVHKTMLFPRLKLATIVLLVVLAFGLAGFGLHWFHPAPLAAAQGQEQQEVPKNLPGKDKPKVEQPAKEKPAAGIARPVVVQEDAQIRSLAWSANGKVVATVGIVYEIVDFTDADGKFTGKGACWPNSTIKLWDATTGQLQRSLDEEKHTYIAAIAFSPDGKTVAISTSKHHEDPLKFVTEVRVLDAQTWALKHKVDVAGFATALVFSPDGTTLALGGRSRLAENGSFVKLWDVRQEKTIGGTEERKEPPLPLGAGGRITCLAFSRDGKLLAAGDENGKLRLFDGPTGKAIWERDGHVAGVSGVGIAADGQTLVSSSTDKTVQLWDAKTGKRLRMLAESKGPVTALAFSPDGRFLAIAATVGEEGKLVEVLLWDAKTWELKKTLPDQTMQVNALAFSSDGTTLAIGAGNGFRLEGDIRSGRFKTPGELKLWKVH
jgi:WD40 repeat protein